MSPNDHDPGIDAEVKRALDLWAMNSGREWELEEVLVGGKSAAVVATMMVSASSAGSGPLGGSHHGRDFPGGRVVLKVCPPGDSPKVEAGRHHDAWRDAPLRFRKRHLLEQIFEPIPCAGDRVLMLQKYAGGDRIASLSSMMKDTDRLARTCKEIVKSILNVWNPSITKLPARVSSSRVMALQLGNVLKSNSTLRVWAEPRPDRVDSSSISGRPLPDPIAFADGRLGNRKLKLITGHAHGDLHPENILLPVGSRYGSAILGGEPPKLNPEDFKLIDLSRYSSTAPLALDPVHFLLSIIRWHLPRLSDPHKDALIASLTSGKGDHGEMLVQLSQVKAAILGAGVSWAQTVGLEDDWNHQAHLALIAAALIFAAKRFPEAERLWYLRLARHATEAYLATMPGVVMRGAETSSPPLLDPAPAQSQTAQLPSWQAPVPAPEPTGAQDAGDDTTRQPSADLTGLEERHITLLRGGVLILGDVIARLDDLDSASPFSPYFAEVYAGVQHSLRALRGALPKLRKEVSIATWPHPNWAKGFLARLRDSERHLAIIDRKWHLIGAFDPKANGGGPEDLRGSLVVLQDLIRTRYASLFPA